VSVIAALSLVIGAVALIFGGYKTWQAKKLAGAPLAATGDIVNQGDIVAGEKGAISAEGEVNCQKILISPASKTECIYYELKVEGSWKHGDSRKSKTYVEEKVAAAFTLDDGSGPVPVDASKGGDFDCLDKTFSETKKEGLFADLKSAVGKREPMMFGEYSFDNPAMSKADTFECTEKVIQVPSRLYVCGKHAEGMVTSPGWTTLIMSTKSRDELLGGTQDLAKKTLIGGGIGIGIGVLLGILSQVGT
jgi:hypothetical protein